MPPVLRRALLIVCTTLVARRVWYRRKPSRSPVLMRDRQSSRGLASAGSGDRGRQGRSSSCSRTATACARLGKPGVVDHGHALRDRFDDQGDDRSAGRHARGREENRLGCAGHHLPAVVPAEGSRGHARAGGSRSADASRRPGQCRLPVVRPAQFDRRNFATRPPHRSRLPGPIEFHLSEHHVRRCWRRDRSGIRTSRGPR